MKTFICTAGTYVQMRAGLKPLLTDIDYDKTSVNMQ